MIKLLTIRSFYYRGPSGGLLFNPNAFWIGAHYSHRAQRWCVNLLPGFTLWYKQYGGTEP
jgi:hypothetical protein